MLRRRSDAADARYLDQTARLPLGNRAAAAHIVQFHGHDLVIRSQMQGLGFTSPERVVDKTTAEPHQDHVKSAAAQIGSGDELRPERAPLPQAPVKTMIQDWRKPAQRY